MAISSRLSDDGMSRPRRRPWRGPEKRRAQDEELHSARFQGGKGRGKVARAHHGVTQRRLIEERPERRKKVDDGGALDGSGRATGK